MRVTWCEMLVVVALGLVVVVPEEAYRRVLVGWVAEAVLVGDLVHRCV